jgi:nicotinamidase-related amidase
MPSKATTASVMPGGGWQEESVRTMARLYPSLTFRPLFADSDSTDNAAHRAIAPFQQENSMSNAPRRALIVIDVQNEYVTGKLPIEYPPIQDSLSNIGRAMDAARAGGVPVIVVQHDSPAAAPLFAKGSAGWQLHPVVAERACDHLVNKTMASAFAGTDLAQWLNEHGIDTLAVAGYMTHNCDASTVLHATHAGLKVEFLVDASGSLPYENAAGKASAEEIHRAFSVVFHSNFAAVATTDDWIAAVQAGTPLERDNIYASNLRARGSAQGSRAA